jgi:Na+-driven multidrug efflux pump
MALGSRSAVFSSDGMTDFGLAGNALVNVLSQAHGSDDQRAAQEYTSSAVWALSAVAALFALAAIVSFRFIPWSAVFKVSTVPSHELTVACALTIVFFIMGLPLSVQNSCLPQCAGIVCASSSNWEPSIS